MCPSELSALVRARIEEVRTAQTRRALSLLDTDDGMTVRALDELTSRLTRRLVGGVIAGIEEAERNGDTVFLDAARRLLGPSP